MTLKFHDTILFFPSSLATEQKRLRAASMYMLKWLQRCSVNSFCSVTRAIVTTAVLQELSLLSLLQRLSHCHYHKSSITPAKERWKLMALTPFELLHDQAAVVPPSAAIFLSPNWQTFFFLRK